MQQADFNHNDFANTAEADKSLMVRFFYKNVQNKMETAKQGRAIFKEKLYIEIRIAGQRDAQACRPATHADKNRFPNHLEAFEKRMEPPTEGTPLSEWGIMPGTQVEEMSFMNVKTVEQLAGMKDANIQNFMGGYKIREQAIKWLETHDKEGEDREKAELKASVAKLTEQVAQLLAAQGGQTNVKVEPYNQPPMITDAEAAALGPAVDTTAPTEQTVADGMDLINKVNELASELDKEPVEGKAVEVPAAPGAKKRAPRKARK